MRHASTNTRRRLRIRDRTAYRDSLETLSMECSAGYLGRNQFMNALPVAARPPCDGGHLDQHLHRKPSFDFFKRRAPVGDRSNVRVETAVTKQHEGLCDVALCSGIGGAQLAE